MYVPWVPARGSVVFISQIWMYKHRECRSEIMIMSKPFNLFLFRLLLFSSLSLSIHLKCIVESDLEALSTKRGS